MSEYLQDVVNIAIFPMPSLKRFGCEKTPQTCGQHLQSGPDNLCQKPPTADDAPKITAKEEELTRLFTELGDGKTMKPTIYCGIGDTTV